jgi:opacity protein-like surface antigen
MRSVKTILTAGTAILATSAAMAADLRMAPPPMPAPIQDFGGWYLRGDVGMSNQRVKSLDNLLYHDPGVSVQNVGLGFSSGMTYGLGVGYQFNNWLRADITGEYRGGTEFHGLDIVSINGVIDSTNDYRAVKSEWLFMANAYADLGTWWCFTPFIGAGIGVTRTTFSDFVDTGTMTPSVAFAPDASKYSFAWALHAGVGYQINRNVTVELAYRYLDLGNGRSGDIQTFDGTNARYNPMDFKGLTSHDIKIGVRFQCCDDLPPPPPPLIRKG